MARKQVATKAASGSKAAKADETEKNSKPVDEMTSLKARVEALEAKLKASAGTQTTGGEDVIDVLTGEVLGRVGGSAPLEKK